jgi:hypothetical protein
MATARSRRVSRALYTSPMPPAPSAERISYGPSRVPGVRAKRVDYTGAAAARTITLGDGAVFRWRTLIAVRPAPC